MTRTEALAAQAVINAERTALYARERAGQVVTVDEWIALGDRQYAVEKVILPTNSQGYYV